MGVCESVNGYLIGNARHLYEDISKANPRLSRKQREFSTTGVVIRIDKPWFKGGGEAQLAARRALADALSAMLSRERSISPGDIRSAHTGIAILNVSGLVKADDAITVFDTAQGGLRLTSTLFDDFASYLQRLGRGFQLTGAEALLSETLVEQLNDWRRELSATEESVPPPMLSDGDELIVYAPSSEVAIRLRGALIHRTLLEPQLLPRAGGEELI